MELSENAMHILRKRYLLKDSEGKVIESPVQMFRRVAKAIAAVDTRYGEKDVKKTEEEFYNVMSELLFLPNSPTLMNAGTKIGQLSACFVLPVEDSIDGIFGALWRMARIHQSGGGTGFSFSKLRPRGDAVMSTKGIASGPVSFMRVFDAATDVIKQGGRRRGANMAVLDVSHPDVAEFVIAKSYEGMLKNFNLSVAVSDKFMKAVENDEWFRLINPRTGNAVKKVMAKKLFELIVEKAWLCGDPGLIFIDEINKMNAMKSIGAINGVNPCGELPLLDYESCVLGSIDVSKFVNEGSDEIECKFDWNKLREVVRTSVHFLDNVIDANRYPFREIEDMTKANRKIGLGVMGFAEMLLKMGIPYDSDKALNIGEELMRFITKEGRERSIELGRERGSFPNFKRSIFAGKYKWLRNATVSTVAPTGTISIIAGTTSGIEPLFAVSFVREVMDGSRMFEVNWLFEKIAKERGFYSRRVMEEVAKRGSVQQIKEVPEEMRRIFVTAHDIKPEWHVRMQAAFQKHNDNAVSKTVNLRHDATKADVKRSYLLAYKLKCKGVTVYRYGSKKEQVLNIGKENVNVHAEYAGGCLKTHCGF